MKKFLFPVLITIIAFASCKKDPVVLKVIVPDNTAPYYGEIPKVTLQNYINRIFIDLIGREPLDTEMIAEENTFRASGISIASREALIIKLQTNNDYLAGDSSYKHAYYNRFYELCKGRVLEASSNDFIKSEAGIVEFAAKGDSISGDSLSFSLKKIIINNYYEVIDCEEDYREDSIEINDVFAQMLNNGVYDKINMNSFNFINAAFNDLFLRFPTSNEFDAAYEMVEYDSPSTLLGTSGQNKGDFIQIMVNSKEFYEGVIVWTYLNLLAREPTVEEVYTIMQTFYTSRDVPKVQQYIMTTDEYANFK